VECYFSPILIKILMCQKKTLLKIPNFSNFREMGIDFYRADRRTDETKLIVALLNCFEEASCTRESL
jgi:hypothetical protein